MVDPFAGSGNTLYWIKRQLAASRAVGFEVDDAVFTTTQNNLDLIAAKLAGHRLLFGVQLYERVDPGSLAAVTARFAWSAPKR